MRGLAVGARGVIAKLEATERERTAIPSLKVRYNNIFGYYIEITKANLERVPADYERKQTLVSAERFTTPALKELERKILTAESALKELELQIFTKLLARPAVARRDDPRNRSRRWRIRRGDVAGESRAASRLRAPQDQHRPADSRARRTSSGARGRDARRASSCPTTSTPSPTRAKSC